MSICLPSSRLSAFHCRLTLPAGLGRVGSVRREGVESKKFRETFAKVGLGSRERKKESWAILKESLMWAQKACAGMGVRRREIRVRTPR